MKPKPEIGELWEICDTVKVNVGTREQHFSSPGLVWWLESIGTTILSEIIIEFCGAEEPRSFYYPTLGRRSNEPISSG